MTIKIQFLGHSAFLIEHQNYNILIDPFLSGNPDANFDPNKIQISDILVTHAHADHLGDSISISKKQNVVVSTIFELANYCSKCGAKARGVNLGGKVSFKWGNAHWLTATHSSSTVSGEYGGCPASILMEIDGKKIFHAGDTGLHYDFKMIGEFYKPDVSLLPIGGFYTMGINEAVQAAKWLRSSIVVPMHYNTFEPIRADAQLFKNRIENETNAKCLVLKPNEGFNLDDSQ